MPEQGLAARVERALGHPPLSEMDADQRRELDGFLAEATVLEDLPGKWQAALLEAEARAGNDPASTHGPAAGG